jgi:hypothetical protein
MRLPRSERVRSGACRAAGIASATFRILARLRLAALLLLACASLPALARPAGRDGPPSSESSQDNRKPGPASAPPAQGKQANGARDRNPTVSIEQALYLVRSTLLTLNDANRSGNYTVLRDLAAPGFQAENSAADLAIIFSDLRRRNIDLFAVAIVAPQLTSPPALDAQGMLRLSGSFPTQPLQIKFDLLFQNVAAKWRLFGISVQTPATAPQAQQQSTDPRAAKRAGQ